MMMVAYSIVVRSAASGAVLCTALVSWSLIGTASLPIARASAMIDSTSAATTRTSTPPITKPSVQPNVLMTAPSDPFSEIADRFQTSVHRGEPVRHGARELRDDGHAAGHLAQ